MTGAEGGRGRGTNLELGAKAKKVLLCIFFLKKYMEMKEIGPMGVRIPSAPWIHQCGWSQKVFRHNSTIFDGHENLLRSSKYWNG